VEFRCLAQIRYKAAPAAAAVVVLSGDKARVVFDAEQRAITPGQAVVFYDGNAVLGGGRIDSANGSCQVERAK
jgi:tRNA-specific 2-thiouridylase